MKYFYSRDPRLNSESQAYTQFLRTGYPPPTDVTVKAMRERSESLHEKINEKLIGIFKGKLEEKIVQISDKTGRIEDRFLRNLLDNLEIPITIYTPTNVSREKIVVFFHGGGKENGCFCSIISKIYV